MYMSCQKGRPRFKRKTGKKQILIAVIIKAKRKSCTVQRSGPNEGLFPPCPRTDQKQESFRPKIRGVPIPRIVQAKNRGCFKPKIRGRFTRPQPMTKKMGHGNGQKYGAFCPAHLSKDKNMG